MARQRAKRLGPAPTWSRLWELANSDDRWKRVVICGLHNLGQERAATGRNEKEYWKACYHGLQDYIMALVGEYGMDEAKAEKETLAEVNGIRNICADYSLDAPMLK